MLRSLFIILSKAQWAQNLIMNWRFAWNLASRFIAGLEINDVIEVVKQLNEKGFNVTVDHLGENTDYIDDAKQATQEVINLLDAIQENTVNANVSIKLTQLGLSIDKNECRSNLERILKRAEETNNFIRIDMEDSTITEVTLEILNGAKTTYSNVGTVIQSYLYRSKRDVIQLMNDCITIRLVKGAYNEAKEVAFPKKTDVDNNFDLLTKICLEKTSGCNLRISDDGRFPPLLAVASHDIERINYAIQQADKLGLANDAFEFQMLYGIRRDIQDSLKSKGYSVRVYVPYGERWYPYFMRRLAERPANLWFFVSSFFKK